MAGEIPKLKEIFTGQRFKQTLSFIWAQLWRGFVLMIGFFVVIFSLAFMIPEKSMLVFEGAMGPLFFQLPMLIVWAYIFYFACYTKEYKSFERLYVAQKPKGVWTWALLWVYVKSLVFAYLLALLLLIPYLILFVSVFGVDGSAITLALESNPPLIWGFGAFSFVWLWVVSLFPSHVILHKGVYRFVPIPRANEGVTSL